MSLNIIYCYVYTVLILYISSTSATTYPNVSESSFSGQMGFFAVPRAAVEEKLAEIHSQIPCLREKLTLPNNPVLPQVLTSDEHVIGVATGIIEATSFIQSENSCVTDKYTLRAPTVQFFIPFLTGSDPHAKPVYKLVLGSFVSTEKPFLQPNMAVPTKQIEQLHITENGLKMKDGDGFFTLLWQAAETCDDVRDETPSHFTDLFVEEFIIPYNYELDFTVCDDLVLQDLDICQSYRDLERATSRNRFNACQTWDNLHNMNKCKLKLMRVEAISKVFEDLSLLSVDQDSVFQIEEEAMASTFIISPCI